MPTYPDIRLYIGGEWKGGEGQPIINPVDEKVLGHVPHATGVDLEAAVSAAAEGFRIWSRTSPSKRADIIFKAARLMRERVESMATAMTLEQGKPIAQARMEVLRASEIMDWDAQEGRRIYGRIIPSEPGMRHSVLRQPIGVVAGFAPWNYPVATPARKIGGALSAGCSIILKASEETPAGAVQLAEAFADAGLPAGVLNVVFGQPAEISDFLISHPTVRMITFTGSIPVGKQLAALAGRHMKSALMELGGHAPVIVCEDADPVATGKMCAITKARNAGQVCVAPTRFFVADAIYDRFTDAFTERAASVKIGNGLDANVEMGPVANERRLAAMEEFVSDARQKGARITTGGNRVGNQGYFFPVTVVADATEEIRAMREEPFGPLALISRVHSLDEAIEKANALPYGLAGYAFTQSAKFAERLSSSLEVGNLSINHLTASSPETPFGGVKDSGFGREGGVEGLQCYTVTKNVSHLTA